MPGPAGTEAGVPCPPSYYKVELIEIYCIPQKNCTAATTHMSTLPPSLSVSSLPCSVLVAVAVWCCLSEAYVLREGPREWLRVVTEDRSLGMWPIWGCQMPQSHSPLKGRIGGGREGRWNVLKIIFKSMWKIENLDHSICTFLRRILLFSLHSWSALG